MSMLLGDATLLWIYFLTLSNCRFVVSEAHQ